MTATPPADQPAPAAATTQEAVPPLDGVVPSHSALAHSPAAPPAAPADPTHASAPSASTEDELIADEAALVVFAR